MILFFFCFFCFEEFHFFVVLCFFAFLLDQERISKAIIKGNSARDKNRVFAAVIETELQRHQCPVEQMVVGLAKLHRGKGFTEEEDVQLVCVR